jgi:copper(I)-binding protein
MHPLARVSVPAHGTLRFASGHEHVMLTGLAAPLRARRTFPITLVRADGGTIRGTVTVRGL